MSPIFEIPASDLASLLPELVLVVAGSVLLLLEAFAPALRRVYLLLALVAVGIAMWSVQGLASGPSFHGLIESTPLTGAFSQAILLATVLGLLAAPGYLSRERLPPGCWCWCAAWSC